MKISILDSGSGNIRAIKNALNFINLDCKFAINKTEISNSNSIIIPGVGSFYQTIQNLKKKKIYDELVKHIFIKKKPVLGICMGMQLLFSSGSEGKEVNGFDVFKGNVDSINNTCNSELTHNVGWQNIKIIKKNLLFKGIPDNENFYFAHKYTPYNFNKLNVTATYKNNGKKMIAAINKKNAYGVQFHPEKSGKFGLKVLKNFSEI